jgi:hypothetical protein
MRINSQSYSSTAKYQSTNPFDTKYTRCLAWSCDFVLGAKILLLLLLNCRAIPYVVRVRMSRFHIQGRKNRTTCYRPLQGVHAEAKAPPCDARTLKLVPISAVDSVFHAEIAPALKRLTRVFFHPFLSLFLVDLAPQFCSVRSSCT